MSKAVQESVSVLWFVSQKSEICGACRNHYSHLESPFFKQVGRAGVSTRDGAGRLRHAPSLSPFLAFQLEVLSLTFLAQDDVCRLISNCHFPCRKVLQSFMAMILTNVCGNLSWNIWQ